MGISVAQLIGFLNFNIMSLVRVRFPNLQSLPLPQFEKEKKKSICWLPLQKVSKRRLRIIKEVEIAIEILIIGNVSVRISFVLNNYVDKLAY